MLFLIAQIKRFGTLNAMQKTAALYTAPFLKNQEKLPKNSQKHIFLLSLTNFWQFFLIFLTNDAL